MLVLTDDEGCSVLRISDETEFVIICFPFEEEVHGFAHAVVTCIVQWRPTSVVQSCDLGTAYQKELEASITALPASVMKRSTFQLIFELKASSLLHQESNDVFVIVHELIEKVHCDSSDSSEGAHSIAVDLVILVELL